MRNKNDETLRTPTGQWVKGTPSPNPTGRPRRIVEAETLQALSEVWTPDEIKEVARTMLSFAKAGNIGAAITILKYQAGAPPESLNLTMQPGNELPDLTDDQVRQLLSDHQAKQLEAGENGSDTDAAPTLSA